MAGLHSTEGFSLLFSGQIIVSHNMDRDPVLEEYELSIEAVDGGLPRKSNVTKVTVHCKVNHAPVFIEVSGLCSILRNTGLGLNCGNQFWLIQTGDINEG